MTDDLTPASHGAPLLASVVVPTSGHRDLVELLLLSLDRQTVSPSSFEVIVVADGATDGTAELVETRASAYRLRCVSRSRGGRSAAVNAGVAIADGSLLLILDDDMQPVAPWLEAHLAAHGESRRRCVVGAVPVAPQPRATPLERWVARNFDEHNEKLAQPGHSFALADFYSGNASIRRDLLEEVGGFDEDFAVVYGNEDLELFARLRNAGVDVVFSRAACAIQTYNKTFPVYLRNTRDAGRTAVLLARKHPELAQELVRFRGGRGVSKRVDDLLLRSTRRSELVPSLLVAVEALLGRVVPGRLSGFYSFVSRHLFWAGVSDAQTGHPPVLHRR